jgi:DNA-binding LacI/PurR family transcriptional regulator
MPTKRATSQDVANRAGVSRTTVSFVLNNVEGVAISPETRQRVMQAAIDLGSFPDAAAQTLASGRSMTVGLVLNRSPHKIVSDTYITQVLDVLVDEVRQHGMRLLLEIVEDDRPAETYLDLVRSKRIDGIIFSGPRFHDEALNALLEDGFPTVLMGNIPGSPVCFVDIDNHAAACQATTHLIQQGHKDIACISNAPATYTAAVERIHGYQDALNEYGLTVDPARVRYGDFSPESGYEQMRALLETKPYPTAVFIASDVVAIGAVAAIREADLRIPEDIALVGFDDVPMARYLEPPLTTVHLPAQQLSRLASTMIMELIQGKRPAQPQVFLNTELIVRKSCGAKQTGAQPQTISLSG